jgi:hypothetical protein
MSAREKGEGSRSRLAARSRDGAHRVLPNLLPVLPGKPLFMPGPPRPCRTAHRIGVGIGAVVPHRVEAISIADVIPRPGRTNARSTNDLRFHTKLSCTSGSEVRANLLSPASQRIEACDIVLVQPVSLKHRPTLSADERPIFPDGGPVVRYLTGGRRFHAAVEAHLVPRDDRSVTIATIDRRVLRRRGELPQSVPGPRRYPRYPARRIGWTPPLPDVLRWIRDIGRRSAVTRPI